MAVVDPTQSMMPDGIANAKRSMPPPLPPLMPPPPGTTAPPPAMGMPPPPPAGAASPGAPIALPPPQGMPPGPMAPPQQPTVKQLLPGLSVEVNDFGMPVFSIPNPDPSKPPIPIDVGAPAKIPKAAQPQKPSKGGP